MAEKQGCSTVVVIMIALVMLVVGGVGGAFAGMTILAPEAERLTAEPADCPPASDPVAAAKMADYALLYPIEESLRVEGKLPPKAVSRMVKDKRFELRQCYQTALDRNPDLKGEMSLQFTVSGDTGKVIAAVERHTDIGDAAAKKCVIDEIKSWAMPKTKGGDSVVKFDVLLIPISSASTDLK